MSIKPERISQTQMPCLASRAAKGRATVLKSALATRYSLWSTLADSVEIEMVKVVRGLVNTLGDQVEYRSGDGSSKKERSARVDPRHALPACRRVVSSRSSRCSVGHPRR